MRPHGNPILGYSVLQTLADFQWNVGWRRVCPTNSIWNTSWQSPENIKFLLLSENFYIWLPCVNHYRLDIHQTLNNGMLSYRDWEKKCSCSFVSVYILYLFTRSYKVVKNSNWDIQCPNTKINTKVNFLLSMIPITQDSLPLSTSFLANSFFNLNLHYK